MIIEREDGVIVVAFGRGSVLVSNVEFPDSPDVGVSLTPTDIRGIGERCDVVEGKTDAEIGAAITMIFPKVESIDVLIKELNVARENLIGRLDL